MSSQLDTLKKSKNAILFIEIAGLLHDIGKLSKAFLEYRQTWQDDPHGYDNDPHDHQYLTKHEVFQSLVPSSFKENSGEIGVTLFGESNFSIKKAVHFHISPGNNDYICKMLNAADGVDSAIDRNNPLWCNEQKDKIFQSNVFGYEPRFINFADQENARKELYGFLGNTLPQYFKTFPDKTRSDILEHIKIAFDQGLSDTTRPQNDTTLWEHSYAVASILKAIVIHNLFCAEGELIDSFEKVKFSIVGIGWDGMKFLSRGQRIGDITGRKSIIKDIKLEIKNLIEYEYPVGNEVYADDNGIYFIAPLEIKTRLHEIWNTIENEVYSITAKISDGELQPHIVTQDSTQTLTSIVAVINGLKDKIVYRFDSTSEKFDKFYLDKLKKVKKNRTICPICRLRSAEDEQAKRKICSFCKRRRSNYENKQGEQSSGTVFIDEIADNNSRAALIVARFGLDEWLNGKMVRTLFVTEAHGIEREIANLGKVKQFEAEEKRIVDFLRENDYGPFNYKRIKGDIDAFCDGKGADRAKHTAFLYVQRVVKGSLFRDIDETRKSWNNLLQTAEKENPRIDICNLLNAKTPTPSTILDVWNTTFNFYKKFADTIIPYLLPQWNRLRISVKLLSQANNDIMLAGAIEAEILNTGKRIELLQIDGATFEIIGEKFSADFPPSKWKGKKIKIIETGLEYEIMNCSAGSAYIPYRVITTSPNLFMILLPAKDTVDITDIMYNRYIEEFGKALGRLPFSIGNIFFTKNMPMFVVLDAGRRMAANFDKLATDERIKTRVFEVEPGMEQDSHCSEIPLKCMIEGTEKRTKLKLPMALGNCGMDYHHPYLIVNDENINIW